MQNDIILSPIHLTELIYQFSKVIDEKLQGLQATNKTPFHLTELMNQFSKVIDEKLQGLQATNKTPSTLPDLLTRQETAKLFKISLVCLNDWSKKGLLQSYRIGGRVMYRRDEVLNSLTKDKNLKYKRR